MGGNCMNEVNALWLLKEFRKVTPIDDGTMDNL